MSEDVCNRQQVATEFFTIAFRKPDGSHDPDVKWTDVFLIKARLVSLSGNWCLRWR